MRVGFSTSQAATLQWATQARQIENTPESALDQTTLRERAEQAAAAAAELEAEVERERVRVDAERRADAERAAAPGP